MSSERRHRQRLDTFSTNWRVLALRGLAALPFGLLVLFWPGFVLAVLTLLFGHEVTVGTRRPEETISRTEPDPYVNPPFSAWQEEHSEVGLGTFGKHNPEIYVL